MKALPIGYDDFREIMEKDLYYVDKTDIIETLLECKNKVSLFPRPRRFGKSLFLSMIDNFFNIEYKEINKDLFNGLKISNSKYYDYLSSIPVIKLDFRFLKQDDFDMAFNNFKELIREIYSNKKYLIDYLSDEKKEIFNRFLTKSAYTEEYQKAIYILSEMLYNYYGKKVIILIDEYDVPIQSGYLKDYYDKIVSFIKDVFSSSLKGNHYLEFAIMTGVLRVSKESLFSDLNNVEVYGIVDKNYNEVFGFTENETKELLKYYNLELNDDVKNMYDGYNFNGTEIFNPWSVLNYAKYKELNDYWVNTSGNELIFEMISKTSDNVKIVIERLLSGESALFEYNDKVTYLDYNNNSLNNILNLLFISGYLTLDNDDSNIFDIKKVRLPNNEVKWFFSKLIRSEMLDNRDITLEMIQNFTEGTLKNNKELMESSLNKILPGMSFMDSTESFYHGFVFGLFSLFLSSNYVVKSNRESGEGRFDLMIMKKDSSIGIIIEFKITKGDEEECALKALSQIEDKEYYNVLKENGIQNILKYAIIFKGKHSIVR